MILGQNKSFHLLQWLKCSCEYLTYKEWKQILSSVYCSLISVSTLPIRNGNRAEEECYLQYQFVSTLPIRNGNVCKLDRHLSHFLRCSEQYIVSTLPIRNGNNTSVSFLLSSLFSIDVSTLPIRNGNTSNLALLDSRVRSKYLTYKEWKRCICQLNFVSTLCKYLTYKEWKLYKSSKISS